MQLFLTMLGYIMTINVSIEGEYTLKTMVIIGAGPGLGFSLAKTFGKNGFRISLVSRTQEKLDKYAEQLGEMGIEAQGFCCRYH